MWRKGGGIWKKQKLRVEEDLGENVISKPFSNMVWTLVWIFGALCLIINLFLFISRNKPLILIYVFGRICRCGNIICALQCQFSGTVIGQSMSSNHIQRLWFVEGSSVIGETIFGGTETLLFGTKFFAKISLDCSFDGLHALFNPGSLLAR